MLSPRPTSDQGQRKKEQAAKTDLLMRPYQVDRWRLDEVAYLASSEASAASQVATVSDDPTRPERDSVTLQHSALSLPCPAHGPAVTQCIKTETCYGTRQIYTVIVKTLQGSGSSKILAGVRKSSLLRNSPCQSMLLETSIFAPIPNMSAKHARNRSRASMWTTLILYYCHRLDQKTPIEKTAEPMKQLKRSGKIKYIGLSECTSESLRRACKVEHVDAVQIEYSPFSFDIESDQIGLLKTARELGVAIVAYSPLGRGMLTGQIRKPNDLAVDDMRKYAPRFSPENFPHNLKLVDRLSEIAKKKGCTASQLTLARILAQGDDFFPILGTTSVQRSGENMGALKIDLSEEEEMEIRKVCQEAEPAGGSYPEEYASTLCVDTPPIYNIRDWL